LERFQGIFAGLDARRTKSPRELDPRRKFDAVECFSMVLFTLLNPVIETTRGLCEASILKEYQRRTSLPKVSLGSFSEAQGVFDPELLSAMLRYGLLANRSSRHLKISELSNPPRFCQICEQVQFSEISK
jgi:hypothetical protein